MTEPDRPQMTIWLMRFACRIPKATNTLADYVNIYYLATAKIVARTRPTITLYVHCLTYYSLNYQPDRRVTVRRVMLPLRVREAICSNFG